MIFKDNVALLLYTVMRILTNLQKNIAKFVHNSKLEL